MNNSAQQSSVFKDSKSHYPILDGLRGVAAITVVLFHIFETFNAANNNDDHVTLFINHGYLAVDFFFVLSGFVIGYAYDDRWGKMNLKEFFKRRLIRLHPMIIIGMLIGAVTFYFQDSTFFPAIHDVPLWKLIVTLLIGLTLIPVTTSFDIRGWTEMHPLDGPAWSLFFEYVANILYALFVRKFSNTLLAILVFICGLFLINLAVFGANGDVIGGWSLDPAQFQIGLIRLMYPFFGGLLLSRIVKPTQIKNAFFWCSLLLIVVLAFPRIGGYDYLWINGIYDSAAIILIFPLIVYLGASGKIRGTKTARVNQFLGDISYPIYIIHYPFIYLQMAWVAHNDAFIKTGTFYAQLMTVLVSGGVLVVSIILAHYSLKWYDIPVRKWLADKYLKKN